MLLQFEHLFVAHQEMPHYETSNTKKHFQKAAEAHCDFLHQQLNYTYIYTPFYTNLSVSTVVYTAILFSESQIISQVLPYASLRAPPHYFIS